MKSLKGNRTRPVTGGRGFSLLRGIPCSRVGPSRLAGSRFLLRWLVYICGFRASIVSPRRIRSSSRWLEGLALRVLIGRRTYFAGERGHKGQGVTPDNAWSRQGGEGNRLRKQRGSLFFSVKGSVLDSIDAGEMALSDPS